MDANLIVLVAISETEVTPYLCTATLKKVLPGVWSQFPCRSMSADTMEENSLSIRRCVCSLARYPPSTSMNTLPGDTKPKMVSEKQAVP